MTTTTIQAVRTAQSLAMLAAINASTERQLLDTGRRTADGAVIALNTGTGRDAVIDPESRMPCGLELWPRILQDRLTGDATAILAALALLLAAVDGAVQDEPDQLAAAVRLDEAECCARALLLRHGHALHAAAAPTASTAQA